MSPELIATIGGILFVTFGGLVGIIYSNLKSEINRVRSNCETEETEQAEWRNKDTEFKLDIVERLARIEAGINGGSDAV